MSDAAIDDVVEDMKRLCLEARQKVLTHRAQAYSAMLDGAPVDQEAVDRMCATIDSAAQNAEETLRALGLWGSL